MATPLSNPFGKVQFASTEDLVLIFSPFLSTASDDYIIGTDTASLTIKAQNGTILTPAMVFDAAVDLWKAVVPAASFVEGEWLAYAESNDVNALPQFLSVWWGDYVDDIGEARQAALGRWKIESNQLTLYEADDITPFMVFDLKDANGDPTSVQIFDKDPV